MTLTVGSLSVTAITLCSATASTTNANAGNAWGYAIGCMEFKYGGTAGASTTMSLVELQLTEELQM